MEPRNKLIMKYLFVLAFIIFQIAGYGQPAGYYDGTEGLSGEELREQLYLIIKDHEVQSNASLWTHFYSTDDRDDGYVWDMYSDVPGGTPAYFFTFGDDQCGNYGGEGDCYNREHSFPKSWYGDQLPMNTDLFHLYPTDGWVNQKRSNYPYGEIDNASWTSTNGSKVGNCSFPGYSGIVFEPIDEYKGDFARSYFYMMTRYMYEVEDWNSDMLEGDNLSQWAENILLEWHENDPLSQKETDRNNAVYDIQENRNPFIDNPTWVYSIWGPTASIGETGYQKVVVSYFNHTIRIKREIDSNGQLTIYNYVGQVVWQKDIHSNFEEIEVKLEPGFYVVAFTGTNEFGSQKLLIRSR
jgi:endonuclease I